MACPTCDHTMQNLGITFHPAVEPSKLTTHDDQPLSTSCPGEVDAMFWCPRCGTIKARRKGSATSIGGEEFVSIHTPFWMQRVPSISLARVGSLIREVGGHGLEYSVDIQRYIDDEIEKRIAGEVERRIHLIRRGVWS